MISGVDYPKMISEKKGQRQYLRTGALGCKTYLKSDEGVEAHVLGDFYYFL